MTIADINLFKHKALQWSSKFDICCLLDSNDFHDPYSRFDFMLAAGAKSTLKCQSGTAFEELKAFYNAHGDWIFGMLSYDLKNEVEALTSVNPDGLQFPDLFFFVPEHLILIQGTELILVSGTKDILNQIYQTDIPELLKSERVSIQNRIDKQTYLSTVSEIQHHISRGDIYELNYCQEFYAEQAGINPFRTYQQLKSISPTPFAAFLKMGEQYILSASPERFLCKRNQKLVSQPIKGTASRSPDPVEDALRRSALQADLKEQTENVMIVDLVRNDLTKNAVFGTVRVEELFGVYSFPQVHQMISTVSCQLRDDVHPIDAIKNMFPMGSMTGAPKIKAMKLIDEFEQRKRSAYSGALGYIDPEGDFDFNVIIRSIFYNAAQAYLSFQVGGAITFAADPLREYEECMLKASAILQTLQT